MNDAEHNDQLLEAAYSHFDAQHWDDAAQLCEQILARDGSLSLVWRLLGLVFLQMKQPEAAVDAMRHAVLLQPDVPEFHLGMGNALQAAGMHQTALIAYEKALRLRPDYFEALANAGNALLQLGRAEHARTALERALSLRGDDLGTLRNLAHVSRLQHQYTKAIEYGRRAMAIDGRFVPVISNLASDLRHTGRIVEAISLCRFARTIPPPRADVQSNLLHYLNYDETASPREVFEEHRQWDTVYAARLAPASAEFANDRSPDRPLRVGYVSADLREHAVAFFIEPVLANHDARAVEVTYYSSHGDTGDAVTRRLQNYGHAWRDISAMDDDAAAQLVRDDRIDVLVDLSGHSAGGRLLLFARRPAPVQVTYLGYPNTTGLRAMDYRLTDPWADPPGQGDDRCSETLFRLPRCAWCYRPPDDAPPPRGPRKNGPIIFGSFNLYAKISDSTIRAWAALLTRVADSRLVIKSKALADEGVRRMALARFADAGLRDVDRRIVLRGPIGTVAEHLAAYLEIDIALDTFPYNGTTTTCEAMWMGVPVIALEGTTHVSRVGVSLLNAVGLPELIAASPEAYIDTAAALADDPARVASLHATLRQRMSESPLCDGPGLARAIESAYRQFWHAWCIR